MHSVRPVPRTMQSYSSSMLSACGCQRMLTSSGVLDTSSIASALSILVYLLYICKSHLPWLKRSIGIYSNTFSEALYRYLLIKCILSIDILQYTVRDDTDAPEVWRTLHQLWPKETIFEAFHYNSCGREHSVPPPPPCRRPGRLSGRAPGVGTSRSCSVLADVAPLLRTGAGVGAWLGLHGDWWRLSWSIRELPRPQNR